ncbi:endonuclease/exonuclease/phosphatase family protein [Bacillus cereus]|uniref:endonuclease/exonuclease/phosphatase family protein n=1 Tax=Bacillus cereus TaxID=1396 RepID=UPI003D184AB3
MVTKSQAVSTPVKDDITKQVRTPEEIKLFFWNLKGKDLSSAVLDIINTINNPDLLIFSETTKETRKALQAALSSLKYVSRTQVDSGKVRVAVFDKLDKATVIEKREEQLFTSLVYQLGEEKFLVAGVHLYSPVSMPSLPDRFLSAHSQAKKIKRIEKKFGIDKTIIMGDFNFNPFERPMVSSESFQAIHCKRTSLIKVLKGAKHYFFNPSWRALGNDSMDGTPPGTHHYVPKNKESLVFHWNMYDQVLIRPKLFSEYTDSFEIITKGQVIESLLHEADFTPDQNKFSDHLPIAYSIKI